jgi:hypothetical protein
MTPFKTRSKVTNTGLWETVKMPKRTVRIVKHIGSVPVVAECTACREQFTAPTNTLRSVKEATENLQGQFDRHECRSG